MQLRDYQLRDMERLRAAMRGARSVLYVAPTGSGKTVLFCAIAHGVVARRRRVWILLHRQELVAQTSRALHAFGLPRGVAHDLVTPGAAPGNAPVQVCSVQTLVRRVRLGGWPAPDLVVIDEAHHATAGSWREVLDSVPGVRVLGVTATPARTDGQGLGRSAGGVFDALVMGPSIRELVAAGWLAPTLCFGLRVRADLDGVPSRGGDFAQGILADRMDRPSITGDAVREYSRLAPGRPALAFCASILHAEHVAAQFRAAGYRAESIDGRLDDDSRRARIEALGDGSIQVLTSCEIVSEGTDIPAVEVAILLRPTQSVVLHCQQIGRAMRPAHGKARALVLDHVGNILRHGLPDEDRPWSLEGQRRGSREREAAAVAVRVQQCPECFAAHAPAATCPWCAHVYAPQLRAPRQVEGELHALTDADVARAREERRRQVGRARTLADLQAIARERGYSPRWAHVMYARRRRG